MVSDPKTEIYKCIKPKKHHIIFVWNDSIKCKKKPWTVIYIYFINVRRRKEARRFLFVYMKGEQMQQKKKQK